MLVTFIPITPKSLLPDRTLAKRLWQFISVLVIAMLLQACGGASSDTNNSSDSNTDSNNTPPPPTATPPDTPTGVVLTVQPTSLRVFWSDASAASSYVAFYATVPEVDEQSPSVTGTNSPIEISGLSEGTTYYVRLQARNASGNSALSPAEQARTLDPPDPVLSVAVSPADGAARVSWSPVSSATRYTVFASTVANDVSNALTVETQLTSVSVNNLSNGTTYYISVQAENIEGIASRSAEQTVIPAQTAGGSGWSQQQLINVPYDFFGRDNYLGGVAINDSGLAAAAWIFDGQTDGNEWVLVNHTGSGDWGAEEILAMGENSIPAVAITPDGTIVVAWVSYFLDDNDFRTGATIVSRRWQNGAWSAAEAIAEVESSTRDYAGAITLAADGLGNVVAAWWQNQQTLWVNRYDGSGWDAPTLLSTSIRNVYPPALGTSATEKAVLVWLQDTLPNDSTQSAGGPSGTSAFASTFDGNNWSAAVRVGHQDLEDFDGAEAMAIDVSPDGSAWAAWQQSRNLDNVDSRAFLIDGLYFNGPAASWSQPVTIADRDWTVGGVDVAITPDGSAIASWIPVILSDNSSTRFYEASQFDPAFANWGPKTPLTIDDGTNEPRDLAVEMTEEGDIFAVWKQTNGIFWRRFYADANQWSSTEQLATRGGDSLAMAMSRNGHVVVVSNPSILSNSSIEYAVYALRYRP